MGTGVDKWLKTNVAEYCAAINIKSFSYNFLCLSLQLNFFIPISCVVPIILQWNNKNSLKVSVKRIQVVDCIHSCLSRHELLLIWRKTPKITVNPLDGSKNKNIKHIWSFGDEFSKYLPSPIFSHSNLIHCILQGWLPLGIRR